MHQISQNNHIPVLAREALQYLDPKPGETYLDVTAGYGGHARMVLEQTSDAPAVLIDRDNHAIEYLRQVFKGRQVELHHDDYLSVSQRLESQGRQFDMILADVGVSSPHLNMASRGFSFAQDGPLDMRMDQRQALTAATIVNTYSEEALAELLRRFGEEPHARKIARAIVAHRPFDRTVTLAALIRRIIPRGKNKTHPATQTFQALRIAINGELTQLEQALPIWIRMLKPGGRLVVISFHSLEDRLVKRALAEAGGNQYDATLRVLTKNPIPADRQEIVSNPRARSAKLRAAVKINTI